MPGRYGNLVRSVLYGYGKNAAGAWNRFLHVRLQKPGKPHPSPIDYRSAKGDAENQRAA